MNNGNKSIPQIGRSKYSVIFYHSITGNIMKYKFSIYEKALRFYTRLDYDKSKPTIYEIKRIM